MKLLKNYFNNGDTSNYGCIQITILHNPIWVNEETDTYKSKYVIRCDGVRKIVGSSTLTPSGLEAKLQRELLFFEQNNCNNIYLSRPGIKTLPIYTRFKSKKRI